MSNTKPYSPAQVYSTDYLPEVDWVEAKEYRNVVALLEMARNALVECEIVFGANGNATMETYCQIILRNIGEM